MTSVRQGVVRVPVPVSFESGSVSLKWREAGSRVTREAPYPPLASDSVSSSQVLPTWKSEGYPYAVAVAAATVVCTGIAS
jgi:hypothetical protein